MKRLSADGDPLEVLARVVDFEAFRQTLMTALAYSDGAKGGRPPYDPVVMLKVLVLAAQNNVSDARMEWLIRDRLSWLRFLGFDLGAPTPDANTIRMFRERLKLAGATGQGNHQARSIAPNLRIRRSPPRRPFQARRIPPAIRHIPVRGLPEPASEPYRPLASEHPDFRGRSDSPDSGAG
ncbi:transposase [Sphingomonas sp.]|uniref:transposase n=1 Tax=Sphingomonas sp. TaxID=28214 RepID=UPI00307F9EF3